MGPLPAGDRGVEYTPHHPITSIYHPNCPETFQSALITAVFESPWAQTRDSDSRKDVQTGKEGFLSCRMIQFPPILQSPPAFHLHPSPSFYIIPLSHPSIISSHLVQCAAAGVTDLALGFRGSFLYSSAGDCIVSFIAGGRDGGSLTCAHCILRRVDSVDHDESCFVVSLHVRSFAIHGFKFVEERGWCEAYRQ